VVCPHRGGSPFLRDQAGIEPDDVVEGRLACGPSSGILSRPLGCLWNPHLRCASPGLRPSAVNRAGNVQQLRRPLGVPSHVHPAAATIARGRGARPPATGSPPSAAASSWAVSCHSTRSLRDRSGAPCPRASQGSGQRWRDCHACPGMRSTTVASSGAQRRPPRKDGTERGVAFASARK